MLHPMSSLFCSLCLIVFLSVSSFVSDAQPSALKELKVAIIGAGVSGLGSAKSCLDEGLTIDVFEQTGSIGGIWNFFNATGDVDENGLPVHSVMYKGLITNLPKDVMEFSDFPHPDIPPSYLPQERVIQYLRDYADYFNLLHHIQFYKQLKKIEPLKDTKWKLTIRDAKTNMTEVRKYDAVMICNGHFHKIVMPKIPGMDLFKGKQMHSSAYRYPEEFANKRVLVVGAGASGVDISVKLSAVAQKVILSHKPKTFFKLPDGISLKPVVTSISEESVTFEDNTQECFDAIIYCTGYTYDFPFLTEESNVKLDNRWIKYLYKNIINVKHTTMGFIGATVEYTPIPVNELQAKFFVAHLKKSFTIPSEEDMLKDIMDRLEYIKTKGWTEKDIHRLGLDQAPYCDDLARIANITPVRPVIHRLYAHVRQDRGNKAVYYRIIDDVNFIQIPLL